METKTTVSTKSEAAPQVKPSEPLKQPEPVTHVSEEPEQYIVVRPMFVQIGPQLVTFEAGDVVDDPALIKSIKESYGLGGIPPMRRVSTAALLAAGKI